MLRLVIIDDEAIVIQGITAIIKRLGLAAEVVGSAQNGLDGREVLEELRPDLVITDIRMPGLDGLSLIEEMREELPQTEFIVVSGYTDFVYAQRAIRLGVADYLDKPITMDKIKAVIEAAEQRKGERNQTEQEELSDDLVINAIILEDSQALREHAENYLAALSLRHASDSRFKEAAYRFLCIIREIYAGSRKQYDEATLVSCDTVMLTESREAVVELVMQQVQHMASQMEADQKGSEHYAISQLVEYINANYSRDIGLTELADQVGMNPAYLSILFKEEMGISYVKYITELRISKAKKYLAEGRRISEVSNMTGFHNYRYFCDVFKKYVGKTPSEYRKEK